jgi:hypothetical protein
MKADAMTENAVKAVMDKVAESYAKRDLAMLRSSFAADPDVVMYGTGADEKRVGLAEIQAQAERDWSQSEAAAIIYRWTSVSAAGSVAWVAGDAAFKLKAAGKRCPYQRASPVSSKSAGSSGSSCRPTFRSPLLARSKVGHILYNKRACVSRSRLVKLTK